MGGGEGGADEVLVAVGDVEDGAYAGVEEPSFRSVSIVDLRMFL